MSGPWEKYVEQAAKAASDSRAPVWRWDCLTDSERESRIGQMRAALAAVGPLIQEDTRERMVAAAGAALEREGVGCVSQCICPPGRDDFDYDVVGDHHNPDRCPLYRRRQDLASLTHVTEWNTELPLSMRLATLREPDAGEVQP